jgi:hypothetical protein
MKKIIFVVFIFMVVWVYGHPQHHYRLQLEKKAVFGGDEPVLERIEGVCEDEDGNFYVLDIKAFKVYKVSPQGKLLLSFGHKGEGPGDFLGPHHIAMSEKGQIIVCEYLSLVSIFDRQGKFITRHNLKDKIGGELFSLKYAGPDLYYVEKLIPENQRKQMLVNLKSDVVTEKLFTLPDISITIQRGDRRARYNVRVHECTPVILFNHFKEYSAAGFSKDYNILILDRQGKRIAHLKRNIKPQKTTLEEKAGFTNAIQGTRLPDDIKKAAIRQLPETKNIFDHLLISHQYVYVFRIKEDVTDTEASYPVDLFSLEGKYLGAMTMKDKPLLVTEKYMYILETDEEDNLFLVKYAYQLMSAGN